MLSDQSGAFMSVHFSLLLKLVPFWGHVRLHADGQKKNMLVLSKDMSSQFSFSLQKCYLALQTCYSAAQVPLLFNSNATYHVQVWKKQYLSKKLKQQKKLQCEKTKTVYLIK